MGLARFSDSRVAEVLIAEGLQQGVPFHANIKQLAKYSKYVAFIMKTRRFFLREIRKHQWEFPGIDGESLFIGTVMHSTDHYQGLKVSSTFDFVEVDPSFAAQAELNRIIHGALSDRLRFLTIDRLCLLRSCRFKHS